MSQHIKIIVIIGLIFFISCTYRIEIRNFIGSKYIIDTEFTFKNNNYKKEKLLLDNIVYEGLSKKFVKVSKNNIYDNYSKGNFYNLYRNKDSEKFHLYPLDYLEISNNRYMIASAYKSLQVDVPNIVVIFIYSDEVLIIQDVIEMKVEDLFPELDKTDDGNIILSVCHQDGTDWFSFYMYSDTNSRFVELQN